jgi:ABC-type transporter Mla subunit MlaD
MKHKKRFIHKAQIIFIIVGLIWCSFVFNYLTVSGWWAGRANLSPMELMGGLSGLFLPLVVLFLISAYFDRNEYLENQGKSLRGYLEELIYPTEEGEVYTKELTKALREQIKEFRAVYDGVNKHTDDVRDNLQRWIEGLNKMVKTVDTQTVSVVQKLAEHVQKLAEITHQSNRQSQETTKLLSGQADVFNEVSQKTHQVMSGFTKELNQEIHEIKNIVHAFETAHQQIANTSESCTKIAKVLSDSGVQVAQAVENFGSVKEVVQQAGDVKKQIQQSEKDLNQKAQSLKNVLSQIHGDMTVVAKGLQQHTQTLEKHLDFKAEQKKDFLREASEITAKLQQFSISLAQLFSPKNEEELWSKYYAGDKAVFMRYLAQNIKTAKAQKIRQLFHQDTLFQSNVVNYMRTFEQMTHQASENASDSPLLAVLIGSEVGRLYMVLADILKGDNS